MRQGGVEGEPRAQRPDNGLDEPASIGRFWDYGGAMVNVAKMRVPANQDEWDCTLLEPSANCIGVAILQAESKHGCR